MCVFVCETETKASNKSTENVTCQDHRGVGGYPVNNDSHYRDGVAR